MNLILRWPVIKALLIKDFHQERKSTLAVMGGLVGIVVFFAVVTREANQDIQSFYLNIFMAFLSIFGFGHTSNIFKEFSQGPTLQDYLLLPASHLEKWLSRWIRSFLIFTVLFTVTMVFSSLVVKAISMYYSDVSTAIFNPFDIKVFYGIAIYFVVHSLSMIGATTFNKKPALKMFLSLFVILIAFNLVFGGLQYLLFFGIESLQAEMQVFSMNLMMRLQQHSDLLLNLGKVLLFGLITPYLYLVSYFKLKEKEV